MLIMPGGPTTPVAKTRCPVVMTASSFDGHVPLLVGLERGSFDVTVCPCVEPESVGVYPQAVGI